jgi:hypothetical protein
MKTYITLDPNNYMRLTLIVPGIALLGSTSCSTADPPSTAQYRSVHRDCSTCI